jgi:hypothetical protein
MDSRIPGARILFRGLGRIFRERRGSGIVLDKTGRALPM